MAQIRNCNWEGSKRWKLQLTTTTFFLEELYGWICFGVRIVLKRHLELTSFQLRMLKSRLEGQWFGLGLCSILENLTIPFKRHGMPS